MQNQQIVEQIADQIIASSGGRDLPEEAKAVFRENLTAQILRRLGLIIIQHLDDEGLKAYEKLTENDILPGTSEMQSFLEQYLPDYEVKVKTGMDEFMKEISGFIQNPPEAAK